MAALVSVITEVRAAIFYFAGLTILYLVNHSFKYIQKLSNDTSASFSVYVT